MASDEEFKRRGQELISALKHQVLNAFSRDPRGQPNGGGLGNSEIESMAGLDIPLDRPPKKKQEHWLTWTIVQRLVADGLVEPVHATRTRYRLSRS